MYDMMHRSMVRFDHFTFRVAVGYIFFISLTCAGHDGAFLPLHILPVLVHFTCGAVMHFDIVSHNESRLQCLTPCIVMHICKSSNVNSISLKLCGYMPTKFFHSESSPSLGYIFNIDIFVCRDDMHRICAKVKWFA